MKYKIELRVWKERAFHCNWKVSFEDLKMPAVATQKTYNKVTSLVIKNPQGREIVDTNYTITPIVLGNDVQQKAET